MQKGKTEEEATQLAQDVKRGKGLGLDLIKADIKKYRTGDLSSSQMFDKGYHFLTPRDYIGAAGGRVGFANGTLSSEDVGKYSFMELMPEFKEEVEEYKRTEFEKKNPPEKIKKLMEKIKKMKKSKKEMMASGGVIDKGGMPEHLTKMKPKIDDDFWINHYRQVLDARLGVMEEIRKRGGPLNPDDAKYIFKQYNELKKYGGDTTEFDQRIKNLSPPAKEPEFAAQGGRIGYEHGGPTLFGDIAEIDLSSNIKDLGSSILEMPGEAWKILKDFPTGIKQIYFNLKSKKEKDDMLKILMGENKAQGGRIGKLGGGLPRIPMGMPRVNAGGIRELDYRQSGGFVPMGVKEKADDVPAMLSKNEFVMTADAVKGAGGGSVEKGAQRMYDTMKRLEGRVV